MTAPRPASTTDRQETTVHVFIDKTGASDEEWRKRLAQFEDGLFSLCRDEYHPDPATTVYCAKGANHAPLDVGGGHRDLAGTEFW